LFTAFSFSPGFSPVFMLGAEARRELEAEHRAKARKDLEPVRSNSRVVRLVPIQ
jgi:hypothetical protein